MTAFAWAGVILIGMLLLIILCIGGCTLVDRIDILLRSRDVKIKDLAVRDLGERLRSDAYWFSENSQVMIFCQCLGEVLRSSSNYSTSNLREAWRKSVSLEKPNVPHNQTKSRAKRL